MSAAVGIHRVRLPGVAAFLSFPERIYRDDPCWVPPLGVWERRRVRAALRAQPDGLVLLEARAASGAVLGTISVRKDSTFADSGLVWFGYFECVEDAAVAAALLGAAQAQARAWGGRVLRGPQNLSRFEFVGLTVAGHDRMPPLMQAHHPRYYMDLLAGLLAPHHDVLAYETPLCGADGTPRALPVGLQEKADAVAAAVPGLSLRAARRQAMGADMEAAFTVLNAAYATVPDINPMSRATFMGLGRAMFSLAGPGLIQLAWQDGQPVGFAVCIPELNEALSRCRGRLLPTGWARLVGGLWGIETAAFKLIGVVPALRGSGLHAALIAAVVAGAQQAGYRRMDGSVIDERNGPMRGVVEGVGMTVYRRYRFYESGLS